MPTILLAWELGGGFGHVVILRRIAARLKVHGFRFVAAVMDLGAAFIAMQGGSERMRRDSASRIIGGAGNPVNPLTGRKEHPAHRIA